MDRTPIEAKLQVCRSHTEAHHDPTAKFADNLPLIVLSLLLVTYPLSLGCLSPTRE